MTDIDYLSPLNAETILAAHIEVLSRANGGTGVVYGNRLTATEPASMDIDVGSGRIKVLGVGLDVDAGAPTITAADEVLDRIDVVTRTAEGVVSIIDGTAAVPVDSKGEENWHQYTSPAPSTTIPAGSVVLGVVYVAAGATTITDADIWMFAANVDDHLVTTIGSPGEDYNFVSEKAIRSALDLKIETSAIATTVSSPGSDSKVTSEQAVREELDLRPLLSLLTTRGDMIRRSDSVWERFAAGAQYTVLAMGANDPAWSTVAALLNTILTTQGDLLYRSSGDSARLAKGAENTILKMGASDPAWATLTALLDTLGSTQGYYLKRGSESWSAGTLDDYRALEIPAGHWQLPDTNPPELVWDAGVNRNRKVNKYDDTTEEFAEAEFTVPDDLDTSGTVTFEVVGYALTAAADKYVQWKFYHIPVHPGANESWDQSYSSVSSGDKACDADQDQDDLHSWTETVSNLGWVAGDRVGIRLSRIAPTGDNLAGDYCVANFVAKIPTVIP